MLKRRSKLLSSQTIYTFPLARILYLETATQVCSVALSEAGHLLHLRESSEQNIHSKVITIFIEEIMKESGFPLSSIDAVAVSKGPGSYTGLRIGVSTAKGICYALDKPLIAISTLQAMAAGMELSQKSIQSNYCLDLGGAPTTKAVGSEYVANDGTDGFSRRTTKKRDFLTSETTSYLFCPMIDARRMEVYSALFDQGLRHVRETRAEIITGDSFREELRDHIVVFAGDGAAKCKPLLQYHPNAVFLDDFRPSSKFMILLAEEKLRRRQFENTAYFEPFYLKDFIPGVPRVKGL